MFGVRARGETFENEVKVEMAFLRKLHGDDASRVAREKAVRPSNRSARRRVLEEAARRLNGVETAESKSLLSRLMGT